MCVWKAKVGVGCFPQSLTALSFKTACLTKHGAPGICLQHPTAFDVEGADLDSNSHADTAGTLPTTSPAGPCMNLFMARLTPPDLPTPAEAPAGSGCASPWA